MPIFFIDTTVGQIHSPDLIGTTFRNSNEATKTAFIALLDIVQDESGLQSAVDVVVSLKECGGTEVFRVCLTTLHNKPKKQTKIPQRSEVSWSGLRQTSSNWPNLQQR